MGLTDSSNHRGENDITTLQYIASEIAYFPDGYRKQAKDAISPRDHTYSNLYIQPHIVPQ